MSLDISSEMKLTNLLEEYIKERRNSFINIPFHLSLKAVEKLKLSAFHERQISYSFHVCLNSLRKGQIAESTSFIISFWLEFLARVEEARLKSF